MAFQGEVGAIGLADVLGNIAANSLAGTLHVTSDRGQAWLAFDAGTISGFSSGPGKAMVAEEIFQLRAPLPEEEIESLLKRRKRSKKSMGEFLAGAEAMTAEAFNGLVTGELLEHAVEVFFWAPARFEFLDGPPSESLFGPPLGVALDVNSLIMEAARRRDHWEMINRVISSPEDVFVKRRPDPPPDKMPDLQKRAYALCNASNSVASIEVALRATRFSTWDAISELARAQMIRPLGPDEMVRLAEEHAKASRTGEAIRLYRRTLETEHANAGVREKLADAYARHGDSGKAAGEYKLLAHRSSEQGEIDGAIAFYRKSLALAPEDYAVREKIVELLRQLGRPLDAATEALKLAVLARKQLMHDRSLTALDAAVECNPDLREAQELRIDTLLSLGRKSEAVRQLEAAADRAADDDAIVKTLQRALKIEPARTDLKARIDDIRSGRSSRRKRMWRRIGIASIFVLLLAGFSAASAWEFRARLRYDAALHESHLALVQGDYEKGLSTLQGFADANPWTLVSRTARKEVDSIRTESIRVLTQRLELAAEAEREALKVRIAGLAVKK